ncbi:energy-coupling factor ABC transporter substrate-binding protein [Clostridiaceae bacterium 68-1-5]|uniref:Cobalt transport protein CbiN n=1 Tax=Suipraeoptans intestinalis TaxID=2606628 RepID=A0A6N7UT39_9FIRM|nr:energy-coupling factor ABC transporter substrate-binding protein [Suipraeoptans intestinalis]MSR94513.1 energy-coupling factor ABC transporter substrate-binding protein [Suipraeoptans intestinalis]
MKKHTKKIVLALLLSSVLIALLPLCLVKNAEFGGSDDQGGTVVETINKDYTPWFTSPIEVFMGGELSGEIESLLFCTQTGIGVGIIAFLLGRFYERKKLKETDRTSNDAG